MTDSSVGLGASAPLQLIRAAATLRWKRPDLTVTLAELALEAADDAATWVAAAGWLLHGRNVLGDGRQIACDLLDGLGRWGGAGSELMAGPQGRRLRVELAGPARRTGERSVARALLAADTGVDALDGELRADVLAELARCAADEAPDTADTALDAAEQAWLAAGCEPGVASVQLVRAARDRRAGRADAAAAAALAGLARVNPSGRRAGGADSEHLAAALTAEWIAALVDAGRLDDARSDAVPAANRLLTATRPSRQLAGLRLAVARVAAVSESADTVVAALEPAAQDAADGDVPELEAACRSMLGELHEAAGRLEAALTAVRAAMAAERCDHDRGARLRTRLAAVTATWAARPSGHDLARSAGLTALPNAASDLIADGVGASPEDHSEPVEIDHGTDASPARRRGPAEAGRRARRLAAEAGVGRGWADAPLPELGVAAAERRDADQPGADTAAHSTAERPESWFHDDTAALRAAPAGRSAGHGAGDARWERPPGPTTTGRPAVTGTPTRSTDTGKSVAVGAPAPSLIGDALLRELIEQPGPGRERDAPTAEPRRPVPERNGAAYHGVDTGVADTVVFELDPRHDSTVAVPPVRPTHDAGDGDATGRHRPQSRGPDAGFPRAENADGHATGPQPGMHPAPAAGADASAAGDPPRTDGPRRTATDTDGLGIGDLLAGALAAYRGI